MKRILVAGRRGNGEGSIYQRKTTDRRWCASVSMGYSDNGKLKRKVVTAKTRAEVVKKLKAIQRQWMTACQSRINQ